MTELFLAVVVIITFFIQGDDRFPAIIYCLIAHLFYFVAEFTTSDAQIFLFGALSDVVLVALLVCINGSLRSRITFFLIPLCVVSILLHFYGWTLHNARADMANFNSLVVFYWCIILALFLSRVGRDGDIVWHSRLLRRSGSDPKNVGVVSK